MSAGSGFESVGYSTQRDGDRKMVEDGLATKTIYPELPPRSEYKITELGLSLIPIIDLMLKWGEEHFDIFERKYGRKCGK